ncbi:MAG: DUF1015 domain-containing protein [Chitinophagaceae bacterium]|nr:MAG: DUF1015 domain-containing protein [Chitinophagaceae bacterium]
MIKVRSFRGVRPAEGLASKVACLPYDVMNTQEAKAMVEGNPNSFLRVTRPEVAFPDEQNPYAPEVYQQAKLSFDKMLSDNILIQDEKPAFYIYKQVMNGREQTGLVACSSVEDYFNDTIKKHEFTRPEKEEDRKQHIMVTKIHSGPVFLTYKKVEEVSQRINSFKKEHKPVYDFTAEDNVKHTLWVIDNQQLVEEIEKLFAEKVPFTYIADGHHRAASSSKASLELDAAGCTFENDEHKYFLTVLFPDDELEIMDYNRVVKDLNGLSEESFLKALSEDFDITEITSREVKPSLLHTISLYLDKKWYSLKAKAHTFDDNDPIRCLDVTVLQDFVLSKHLDIKDPRTDKRVDFVGGIRGMEGLQKRVDNSDMKAAFALYPVTIQQLIEISDAGKVMPPKSTWFEPKLRSGMVVHKF